MAAELAVVTADAIQALQQREVAEQCVRLGG
jgi:hypothetical protein